MKRFFVYLSLSAISLGFWGCQKGEGINIFSIQDDIALGQQTKEQIASDPTEYPILSENSNPAAYAYLKAIRDDLLNSGSIKYADQFPWELYIIKRDDVQNAFCAPGGYIYVYTGLIKVLDSKSALAGVLGHEMAHADRRHATKQLTKQYGIQTLLDVTLGQNHGMLADIAASLVSLKFSRNDETDADNHSVSYLCPTKYHSDGAALFFKKLLEMGTSTPPAFLSTHPSPDNRVKNIEQQAEEMGCSSTITNQEETNDYTTFKNSL